MGESSTAGPGPVLQNRSHGLEEESAATVKEKMLWAVSGGSDSDVSTVNFLPHHDNKPRYAGPCRNLTQDLPTGLSSHFIPLPEATPLHLALNLVTITRLLQRERKHL